MSNIREIYIPFQISFRANFPHQILLKIGKKYFGRPQKMQFIRHSASLNVPQVSIRWKILTFLQSLLKNRDDLSAKENDLASH
jgi:hypothetical protein